MAPEETCRRIAADIEALRGSRPQLQDFRADRDRQINTQPVIPEWRIGSRRVTFLIEPIACS